MLLDSQRHAFASSVHPSVDLLTQLEGLERRFQRNQWLYRALVVVLCCLTWLTATQIVRVIGFGGFYGIPFALAAVIVASWMAGLSAGLLAAVLSVLLLHMILPAVRVMDVEQESAWHLTVFTLVALIMSSFEASVRERRLRDAREKEIRDEFLAIVSHELRTPVTVISGSANLLSRLWDGLSVQDRSEVLDSLQEESSRLTRMIEDLLLLARIEAQPAPADEPIQLHRRLKHSVEGFRHLYPSRTIDLALPEDLWLIAGNDTYFDAVMRNILGNAHRFSPASEPIHVSAVRTKEHVLVRVRDHGPGVSKRLIDKIYEPYVKSQPIADGTRGLGLGLTLCKRAMESMGGKIGAKTLDQGGLEVELTFRSEEPEQNES